MSGPQGIVLVAVLVVAVGIPVAIAGPASTSASACTTAPLTLPLISKPASAIICRSAEEAWPSLVR